MEKLKKGEWSNHGEPLHVHRKLSQVGSGKGPPRGTQTAVWDPLRRRALVPGGSEGSGMACIRVAQKSCAPERGEGEGESGEDQVARGGAGECGKPAPWLLFSEETSPLLLPVGGF